MEDCANLQSKFIVSRISIRMFADASILERDAIVRGVLKLCDTIQARFADVIAVRVRTSL